MALGPDPPHKRRILCSAGANEEKGRPHPGARQRLEHLWGRLRRRAIVEGQHDLAIAQRQGLGVGAQPDPEPALRADRQNPHRGPAAGGNGRKRARSGGDGAQQGMAAG